MSKAKNGFLKNYGFLCIMLSAIVLGCVLGAIWPGATCLEPLGTVFINLMFCIVVPMVFSSIASAIANMSSRKRAGKIVTTTIVTFVVTGAFAAAIMIVLMKLFPPVLTAWNGLETAEIGEHASIAELIVNFFTVGILTELSVDASGKVKWIVVGIGVNVNTHLDELPEEGRGTATSLAIERGLDCSRLELVRSICYQMETLYRDFLDQGADAQSFLPRYRIYSSTLARHVRMFAGTEEINGVAEDFDKDGALLIRTDDGALRRVFTGEVTSRPPQDAANEASAADAGGNAQ